MTVTAPEGPPQNPDVAYALADQKARLPAIRLYRDYYEGRHLVCLPPESTDTSNKTMRELLERLRDNMCDDVVDETVSRLEVRAWTASAADPDIPDLDGDGPEPTPQETDDLGAQAQEVWDANRNASREPRLYRDALWSGDGWDIVERGTDERVRNFPQRPESMGCRYREDQPDTIEVAWKVWRSGNVWRLNLYYGADCGIPGRAAGLERYQAPKGTDNSLPDAEKFVQVVEQDATTGEVLTDARPEWTRCPVFHYPNEAVGEYGRSVLHDVIPLNDLLNKALADLVVDSEEQALPQRWGIGVQAKTDEVTGEALPLKRGASTRGHMLTTTNSEASFGQFEGVDMSPRLAIIQGYRIEIARKGYLPPYSVGDVGGIASGLSLLVQEGRQVKRCKARARDWGEVHAEKVAFMLRLAGVKSASAADLEPEWANPGTRDEQAIWDLALTKQSLGVPRERLLVEGGYTAAEAKEWTEAAAADAGGRISQAGPGVASVTIPGMSGGIPVPTDGLGIGLPAQPVGAGAPGVPGN